TSTLSFFCNHFSRLHSFPIRLSSPRPPESTLFPYTTLFRSRHDLGSQGNAVAATQLFDRIHAAQTQELRIFTTDALDPHQIGHVGPFQEIRGRQIGGLRELRATGARRRPLEQRLRRSNPCLA